MYLFPAVLILNEEKKRGKPDPDYEGAEATIEFIRIFDELFDRCNAKHPKGAGTKASIGRRNRDEWFAHVLKSRCDILED